MSNRWPHSIPLSFSLSRSSFPSRARQPPRFIFLFFSFPNQNDSTRLGYSLERERDPVGSCYSFRRQTQNFMRRRREWSSLEIQKNDIKTIRAEKWIKPIDFWWPQLLERDKQPLCFCFSSFEESADCPGSQTRMEREIAKEVFFFLFLLVHFFFFSEWQKISRVCSRAQNGLRWIDRQTPLLFVRLSVYRRRSLVSSSSSCLSRSVL